MRITDIHIDWFGAWRDLNLRLPDQGIAVFYGPNEAGKTTLMRFIRGVLFGFPKPTFDPGTPSIADAGTVMPVELGRSGGAWGGELGIEWKGHPGRIRRIAKAVTRGQVEVTGLETETTEPLAELLQGIDERSYEHVFAIGLREIQELGTLQDGEIADRIYGLTLGPEGQQLLAETVRLQEARAQLIHPAQHDGELINLCARRDQIRAELHALEKELRQHREVSREREKLETEVADLKRRQSGITSQLRGHSLLQRVWAPWNRVQECRLALDELPHVQDFPEDGLNKLSEIEREIVDATAIRDRLQAEAKRLREQAASLNLDPELKDHAGSIQGLLDQREWVRQIEDRVEQTHAHAESIKGELDQKLDELGANWTLKRLENTDTSAAAHLRLANLAHSFRGALARRARIKRTVDRLENHCKERAAAIKQRVKQLGGDSVAEALVRARQKLEDIENLAQLKLQETELQQRLIGIDEQRERFETRLALPVWVYLVLGFFAVAGLALGGFGMYASLQTSALVGLIYALVGITCAGISRALVTHFESEVAIRIQSLNQDADDHHRALRRVREKIVRFATAGLQRSLEGTDPLSVPDLIRQQTVRITELEQLGRAEQHLERLRRKLDQRKNRRQLSEREVGSARQAWQELLAQLGFLPNLRIEEVFDAWRIVMESAELKQKRDAAQHELAQLRWIAQGFHQRVEELSRKLQAANAASAGMHSSQLLEVWESQLRMAVTSRKERRQVRQEAESRTREALEQQAVVDELKTRRLAFLVQGGASTREQFELRAEWAERRIQLEEELAVAREDLELAAADSGDMAIVEEDLRAYDATNNREHLDMLNMEAEDIERDLEQSYERLGSLKAELKGFEQDRRSANLRFELATIETGIEKIAEKWLGLEIAAQSLGRLRSRYERNCQPAMLADASRYLARLTHNRYRNIWTPLGERRLSVDDEHGRTLSVEHLSRGTREQLFLAIRLALVHAFHRRGIALPIVLDDILVNFDQQRTEAAAEVLRDFSDEGHQVLLFTSHLHLAHHFETQGVEPIWLPTRQHPHSNERRAG